MTKAELGELIAIVKTRRDEYLCGTSIDVARRQENDWFLSLLEKYDEEEKIKYPICPINLFFEGDEDKCNPDLCDWDTESRSCTEACKNKGNGDYEHCQNCGKEYKYIWTAQDNLWKEITKKRDESGLLCIKCFDELARKNGYKLYWKCEIIQDYPKDIWGLM